MIIEGKPLKQRPGEALAAGIRGHAEILEAIHEHAERAAAEREQLRAELAAARLDRGLPGVGTWAAAGAAPGS